MNFILIFTFTGILAMVTIKAAPSPSSESGKNYDEAFNGTFGGEFDGAKPPGEDDIPSDPKEDPSHSLAKRQMDFSAAPQLMMGMAMQAKDNMLGAMQNGSNPMEAMAGEAGSVAEMASSFMGSMGG